MPEYMDYNDVEIGYKSKRHKIFSNISFWLSVAFLLFVVIWTLTHLPENVRTKFDPVYSSAHKVDEQVENSENEFVDFDKLFVLDTKVNINKEFKQDFSKIISLVTPTKLDLSEKKVKSYDFGNSFVIAMSYEVDRQTDANGNYYDDGKDYVIGTIGVDVCVFDYSTDGGFTVCKPVKYSIRYYNNVNDLTPTIEKVYVDNESFRLNFYTLSVVVESKNQFNKVKTTLNLEEGINKQEYEKQTFVDKQFAKSKEQKDLIKTFFVENRERGEKQVSNSMTIENTNYAEIGINFDDAMYNKFSSFKVDKIKNATYKIKVN